MCHLIPEKSMVFCPPRLGKPDPTVPRPLSGEDTRSRIPQKGARNNTCWYYVFNMLRERFKAPNTDCLVGRKFERIASMRRKSIAEYESTLPGITNALHVDLIYKLLIGLSKEAVQRPGSEVVLRALNFNGQAGRIEAVIPAFLAQTSYKNLYEYLNYLKNYKRLEIDQAFFSNMQLERTTLYDCCRRSDPVTYHGVDHGKGWDGLSQSAKGCCSDTLVKLVSAKMYGLKISSWHPSQPFKSLLEELRTKGPLAVQGAFGSPLYLCPATKLEAKVGGRDIYGWPENSFRNSYNVSWHMILLVGAATMGCKNLVYFIDPLDESDPKHPEKQRVYVMSYKRLTSDDSICDLHGFVGVQSSQAVGYAFYKESVTEGSIGLGAPTICIKPCS